MLFAVSASIVDWVLPPSGLFPQAQMKNAVPIASSGCLNMAVLHGLHYV
jgi:hypothetical protein